MPPIVLINSLAAKAYQSGAGAGEVIARAYAESGIAADVRTVHSRDFDRELASARRRESPVVIAGGDGSVSAAAQVFAGTGIPVGVLPLGTYNLLAQDLGISSSLEDAVGQLAQGVTAEIDLGMIEGRYFHTLAGLGFFARTARERASIRKHVPGLRAIGAFIAAWRSLASQGALYVEVDDGREVRTIRSPALIVTNNVLDDATWRRPRLDEGLLELHAANDAISFSLLRGGFAAVRGIWRQHPGVEIWKAPVIELRFRRPRVFASLDGELLRRATPLRLSIAPRALTCIVGRQIKTA